MRAIFSHSISDLIYIEREHLINMRGDVMDKKEDIYWRFRCDRCGKILVYMITYGHHNWSELICEECYDVLL
jgi:hypothetical protein